MKLSYIMQLVFYQLGKRKLSYAFLSVLLMLISFLMIILIMYIYMDGEDYLTLLKFKDPNVFISSLSVDELPSVVSDKDLSAVKIERISDFGVYEEKNIESATNAIIYGQIMADNMYIELLEGTQLRNAEIKDGARPIIVPEYSKYAKYYGTGQTFDIYYYDPRFMDPFASESTLSPIRVYVCGIMRFPYSIYDLNSRFPASISEFLITIENEERKLWNCFIIKDFLLDEELLLSQTRNQGEALSIVSINTEDEKQYNSIYSAISSKYTTVFIKDLIKDNYDSFMSAVGDYIISYIVVIIFAILSFAGINIYLFQSLKKEYSLYFMCGAKWSLCLILEFIRNFMVITVPVGIGTLTIFLYLLGEESALLYYFKPEYILYMILFIVLIFVVTTLYFLIKLARTKPIENIRLMVKE